MSKAPGDFGKQLFDRILQQAIWLRIKHNFLRSAHQGELFCDDKENILAIKFKSCVVMVGYFHFFQPLCVTDNYLDMHRQINGFTIEMMELAEKEKWLPIKLYMISSDQLSRIKGFKFNELLSTVNYYFIKPQKSEVNSGPLIPDEVLNQREEYDDFLYYAINRDRIKHGFDPSWNCDICGGNFITGCQYHDPTECPNE